MKPLIQYMASRVCFQTDSQKRNPDSKKNALFASWQRNSIAMLFALSLAACGGGSGGSGGAAATATVKGRVIDGPFANAPVEVRSGSPTGTVLGSATTDGSGNYSISFPVQSGTGPLFVTSYNSSNDYLGSYIGAASSVTGSVSSSNFPNLNVTQATTAGLVVVQASGTSFSNFTPAIYQNEIVQLESVVVQLAAVVQDLVDQPGTDSSCSISGGVTLANLGTILPTGSSLVPTANIYTAASRKTTGCTTSEMTTLGSQIQANPILATQLTSVSATSNTGVSVPAGTYTGTLTPLQTYVSSASSQCAGTPTPFTATFIVGSSGSLSFSSSNNNGSGSGTLSGSNFTLSITPGGGQGTISATGAFVPLSNITGGSGFSVNGGWQQSCSDGTTVYGTYSAPSLLSSGANVTPTTSTTTSSAIPNGSYQVTIVPNNSGSCSNGSSMTATIVISNGTITLTSSNAGNGSGTVTGNTFTMAVTPNSGGGSIAVTGTMSSPSSGALYVSGNFTETGSSYCNDSGTFNMNT